MTVIVCDLCGKPLQPRAKGNYDWFSKGGLVALVDGMPARLTCQGKDVQECCTDCASKTYARATVRV